MSAVVLTRQQAQELADRVEDSAGNWITEDNLTLVAALQAIARGEVRLSVRCDHSTGKYDRGYHSCDCCNDTGWRLAGEGS